MDLSSDRHADGTRQPAGLAREPRPNCTVCARADTAAIDSALTARVSFRSVAKTFDCGRTAVKNHAAHLGVVDTRERTAAARGKLRRRRRVQTIDLPAIETPADVARELEWQYREAKALVEHGKTTSDTRLIDKALATCGTVMDKFAKVLGLYSDGATITIDRSTRILNVLSAMPEDRLRGLLERAERGESIALEAVS